jgi:hypothetical protein
MLVGCHFAMKIWDAVITLIIGNGSWRGDSLTKNLILWLKNNILEDFGALPLSVCRSIWTSRNVMLFVAKVVFPLQVFFKIMYYFEGFHKVIVAKMSRLIISPPIDDSKMWGYFNGAYMRESR